jgi:hypothetical protein
MREEGSMAEERISLDLEGIGDIPDPAAHLAARPLPEAKVPAEPSRTRPDRARLDRAAVAAGFAWVALAAFGLGFREDLHHAAVAAPLALWTLLAGLGVLFMQRPRRRGLPVGIRAVQGLLVAVPLVFFVSAAATTPEEHATAAEHVFCLAVSNGIAFTLFALAAAVLRGSFLSAPAWRGAGIGALCGLGGTVGIQAHCPVSGLLHVGVAHGLAIAVGAAAGAAAGARWGRA